MRRTTILIAALGVMTALPPPQRATAQPARAAMIVGNATYAALPGIQGCARSANSVAAALRAQGFQVTDRQDVSTGGVDAAISEFSQHLTATGPGGAGFVYVCGYAMDFNDRTFVLPISARIDRPSDVLTQGVLAKSLLTPMSRDPATVGIVAFDLVPKMDAPAKLGIDALAAQPVPDGVAVIAVAEAPPGDAPTPLAKALVAALGVPSARTGEILDKVRAQLTGSPMAAHAPVRSALVVGPAPAVAQSGSMAPGGAPRTGSPTAPASPTAPPSQPAPAAAPQTMPGGAASQPALGAAASVPAAASPSEKLPDEAEMTESSRRAVQGALGRLGYYDSQVDGLFGPETRAAIRRYQHEIGAEPTGHITADEATRLVNSH